MVMTTKNEVVVAVTATMGVMGSLYYYFARVSNPFRPWLLMRFFAYQYGDPKKEDSISPHHGVHYITLKSIKTLVEGIPGKICAVRTYTFALPDKDALLANTISLGHGDLIKVHTMPTAPPDLAEKAGGHKNYSPTDVSTRGQIDLTVKIYPNGVNSQVFEALKVGESIGVSGPWPPTKMRMKRLPGKKVNLVSFGVGITEAIEVCKAELAQTDADSVKLLYANRYREDAFFRDELEELKSRHPDRFRLVYLYSRESASQLQEGELGGRVTAKILRQVFDLPTSADQPGHSDQRFVIPGSKQMIQDTWDKYLKDFEYNRKDHSLLLLEMFGGQKERSQKMYKKLGKKEKNKEQ